MITTDIQKLEPGSRIELFELDITELGGDLIRFHAYPQLESIWWQGQEYSGWALQATGFELTSSGQQPRPTLSLSNIGYDAGGKEITGVFTAWCLKFDDLVGAKLIRHQTLTQYLDARNFPDGNPTADPGEHFPDTVWFIEQRSTETPEQIDFLLSSALDFNGQQLPGRRIYAGRCSWLLIDPKVGGGYRGTYCGYTGSRMFDEDGNAISDPARDKCGGRLSDCKKRFGEWEVVNFGSFPSVDRLRGY